MLSQTLLTLALAATTTAHFKVNWPPAEFVDETEATGPCGGVTPVVNSSSPSLNVDRFAMSILSTHPEGQWQFRGTLDTEEPYTWTDLTPVVNTTGLGTFCLNYLYAPADFAGQAGIVQVTDNSPDGTLYQCSPVNFISGANETLGAACTNASSFSASWTSAQALVGNASESASASHSGDHSMASETGSSTAAATGSSTSAAAAAASATSSAAGAMITGSFVAGLGAIAALAL